MGKKLSKSYIIKKTIKVLVPNISEVDLRRMYAVTRGILKGKELKPSGLKRAINKAQKILNEVYGRSVVVNKKLTKRAKVIKEVKKKPIARGNKVLNDQALLRKQVAEKYWYENGGEKFVRPREIRSNKIFPDNNDLNNESGSQLTDDIGFGPTQQ